MQTEEAKMLYSGADESQVREIVPGLKDKVTAEAMTPTAQASKVEDRPCSALTLGIMRETFMRVVQNVYWEMVSEGLLPRKSRTVRVLLESTDEAMANSSHGLNDLDLILGHFQVDRVMEERQTAPEGGMWNWLARTWPFSSIHYFQTMTYEAWEEAVVYATTALIFAHSRARSE